MAAISFWHNGCAAAYLTRKSDPLPDDIVRSFDHAKKSEVTLFVRGDATDTETFECDVGNLCILDPRPIPPDSLDPDATHGIKELAVDATRVLFSTLSRLPRYLSPDVVSLPPTATLLPRAKPFPTAKPLTRWEAFAKEKGIQKKKREKYVWDDGTSEWKRRYGYNRANDPKDVVIVEAKPTDVPGESPFEKMEDAKKERVAKQRQRELRNVERAVQHGERLPSTVQLVADLPKHGKGHPLQRKDMKDGIEKASRIAGLSTASLGKFDARSRDETSDERISTQKKRSLLNSHELGEKQFLDKMSERMVKEHSESILNVEKAMGRLEADHRRHRHQERIDAALESDSRPRSQKKRLKKRLGSEDSLPKIRISSRQKKMKKRQHRR